jgi:putative PIN family toxin of toxin-antitoxin system
MRALLDTNVLAAGILGEVRESQLPPAEILRRWNAKQFELIVSRHILGELEQTLALAWFTHRIPATVVDRTLELLQRDAVIIEVTAFVSGVAGHVEDDLVLAAAVSGNADFLVTGDAEFLQVGEYRGVRIRTPAAFLRELDLELLRANSED